MRLFRSAPWAVLSLLVTSPLAAQNAMLVPSGPLTLDEAMRWAWQRGVAASVARLNVDVADARVGQRRADLLPQVAGEADYSRQTLNLDEFGIPIATGITDPFNLYHFRLNGSQTLVNLAALSRVQSASDSSVAARFDAQSTGSNAAAVAGVAYVRVLGIAETIRAREADSAIAADLLAQARQLADAGVSAAIDVTRNEVNLAAVLTQLVITRNQLARARLDLARALSIPPETPIELADSLGQEDQALPTSQDSAVAFAEAHRPELLAEQRRTEAVRLSRRAVGQEHLPSAGIAGQVQESGQQTDALAGTWVVQVGVSIPVFDGLRRQKRRDEASARYDAQKLREYDVTQQVDAEARQVVLDLTAAREELRVAVQRLRLADLELKQADERVSAGVAGSVETTNAQRNLVGARDALIQARVSLDIARVNSYRALGIIVPANGQ
jgi:outer membrane protein TolC